MNTKSHGSDDSSKKQKRKKKAFVSKFTEMLQSEFEDLDLDQKIEWLNCLKIEMAKLSPQSSEPVDAVIWVRSEDIVGNEYNPNKVAPPEMRLLHLSVKADGFTQPIVAFWDNDLERYIIVDGFHRARVGKEYDDIGSRVHGYLPITVIDKSLNERMASTVRHNRARGTHEIRGMGEIVAELHLKGWSNVRIARELGMEKDEVLKLKQFMGLGDLFRHRDFSKAWI